MYTNYSGVLLLYIRWSLIYMVSYILLWAHLMYTNYCGVLLLYIRWSLIYIYCAKCTITGQSYVHQLFWGLTLVHKMVPYIYIVPNVLLRVNLMYTNYCGVLLLCIRLSCVLLWVRLVCAGCCGVCCSCA